MLKGYVVEKIKLAQGCLDDGDRDGAKRHMCAVFDSDAPETDRDRFLELLQLHRTGQGSMDDLCAKHDHFYGISLSQK